MGVISRLIPTFLPCTDCGGRGEYEEYVSPKEPITFSVGDFAFSVLDSQRRYNLTSIEIIEYMRIPKEICVRHQSTGKVARLRILKNHVAYNGSHNDFMNDKGNAYEANVPDTQRKLTRAQTEKPFG